MKKIFFIKISSLFLFVATTDNFFQGRIMAKIFSSFFLASSNFQSPT